MKCPKSGILQIITGWGESDKVILRVNIAVFWALSKHFSGKDGSTPSPGKKLARTPMCRVSTSQWRKFGGCYYSYAVLVL